jgi:two-component sensor histidine kinase
MDNKFKELEEIILFSSQEIRSMATEIKRLYQELDLERMKTDMLLDILARNDRIDEKDRHIITLQVKVDRAINMLEDSADPLDIVKMLKAKADFLESHPNF